MKYEITSDELQKAISANAEISKVFREASKRQLSTKYDVNRNEFKIRKAIDLLRLERFTKHPQQAVIFNSISKEVNFYVEKSTHRALLYLHNVMKQASDADALLMDLGLSDLTDVFGKIFTIAMSISETIVEALEEKQ